MAGLRIAVVFVACLLAIASASPIFFGKGKSEHVVIHVPYKVHTHHHHHVEKVHFPVVKHVPVYKEVHVPIYKEVPVPVHVHHEPVHVHHATSHIHESEHIHHGHNDWDHHGDWW